MNDRVEADRLGDVIWGLRWGLQMAAGFAVIAVAFLAINELPPSQPAEVPVSPVYLFLLYLACGVISGVLVGLLRAQLANRGSANMVGILAAMPWYFGIRVLAFGWSNWSPVDIVFLLVAPILVGTFVSQLIWIREHRSESP